MARPGTATLRIQAVARAGEQNLLVREQFQARRRKGEFLRSFTYLAVMPCETPARVVLALVFLVLLMKRSVAEKGARTDGE